MKADEYTNGAVLLYKEADHPDASGLSSFERRRFGCLVSRTMGSSVGEGDDGGGDGEGELESLGDAIVAKRIFRGLVL